MNTKAPRQHPNRLASAIAAAFSVAAIVVGPTAPVAALYGVIDEVPAATLLIPYFEVQIEDEQLRRNTTLTVVNSDDSEVSICLAHFTLWTDLGLPTVSFTAALPPGGSLRVDLGELFLTGSLPFAGFGDSCEALEEQAPFSASALRRAHLGTASDVFGGMCGARRLDDSVMRGFVTVDTVDDCTDQTPADAAYFMGTATEENILIGHYVIERQVPFAAVAAPAVHIEASSANAGLETFYYRFGGLFSTDDAREPLVAAAWSTGYLTDLSEIICWHDQFLGAPIACNSSPFFELLPFEVRDHTGREDVADFGFLCAPASAKQLAGDLSLETRSKTGSLTVEVNQPSVALRFGGFEPRRQTYLSAIHYLHPLGLGIHVPGTAAIGNLAPPLLTADDPSQADR